MKQNVSKKMQARCAIEIESEAEKVEASTSQAVRLVLSSLGGGGAEHVAVELCRQWANDGVKIQVVLLREGGVRVGDLPASVELHVLNIKRARYCLPKLVLWEKRHGRCPTLAFGFEAAFAFAFGKSIGLLQSPLIFREGSLPEANLSWARRLLYSLLLRNSDAVIVQSDSMIRRVGRRQKNAQKIIAIPNPVQASLAPKNPEPDKAWEPREAVRLLSIGRLSPEKGFSELIEAFLSVHQARPGSALIIYGEGKQRTQLEHLIAQNHLANAVRLPGYKRIDEMIWQQADIFVLPSRYEGQPNALMQAIAAGKRVISTPASPATIDLLQACGLEKATIACMRAEDLRAKVDWCLTSPSSLWSQASTKLVEMADAANVAQRYLECFGRLRQEEA